MSDNVTLKPCPFCGCSHITDRHVRDGWQMFCPNCGASAAPAFHGRSNDTKAQAITAWNTRAEQSVPNSVVEALQDIGVGAFNLMDEFGISAPVNVRQLADGTHPALLALKQSGQTEAELLREARDALHQHYVDWDGEPEDAFALYEARNRIDAYLSQGEGA